MFNKGNNADLFNYKEDLYIWYGLIYKFCKQLCKQSQNSKEFGCNLYNQELMGETNNHEN